VYDPKQWRYLNGPGVQPVYHWKVEPGAPRVQTPSGQSSWSLLVQ
jgi:hypothetical protein